MHSILPVLLSGEQMLKLLLFYHGNLSIGTLLTHKWTLLHIPYLIRPAHHLPLKNHFL